MKLSLFTVSPLTPTLSCALILGNWVLQLRRNWEARLGELSYALLPGFNSCPVELLLGSLCSLAQLPGFGRSELLGLKLVGHRS